MTEAQLKELKEYMEPIALEVLNNLRDYMKEMDALAKLEDPEHKDHTFSEPEDWTSDEFVWGMFHKITDDGLNLDVQVSLAESKEYDGTEGGVSFNFTCTFSDGSIVGMWAPCNYTNEVWVFENAEYDEDPLLKIKERLAMFRQLDIVGTANILFDAIDSILLQQGIRKGGLGWDSTAK